MAIPKTSNSYPASLNYSVHLEIRLFYVRISPCVVGIVPDHLTLRHVHRDLGVSLEINGARVPDLNPASIALRRDRVDKDSLEVTYLSTDSVRITGGVEFEVLENEELVLCGSLERVDDNWSSVSTGLENDSNKGWFMDCYVASLGSPSSSSSSAFFQPKMGVSSPSIEVYIAGRCSGVPVILTKTIQVSPRRKGSRHGTLDAIPEDEEIGKEQNIGNGLVRHRDLQMVAAEADDYGLDSKFGHPYYSEDMYTGEDGQLSWFNAGVRVGVGIGLGMCLGVGVVV